MWAFLTDLTGLLELRYFRAFPPQTVSRESIRPTLLWRVAIKINYALRMTLAHGLPKKPRDLAHFSRFSRSSARHLTDHLHKSSTGHEWRRISRHTARESVCCRKRLLFFVFAHRRIITDFPFSDCHHHQLPVLSDSLPGSSRPFICCDVCPTSPLRLMWQFSSLCCLADVAAL